MAQIERGGVSTLFIGGATYEVSAEITIKFGGIMRTPVIGSAGVAGYSTRFANPEVEFEALDGPAVSVANFRGIANVPLQIQLNNGKSYLIANATNIDDVSIKVHDGKISGLKFSGDYVQEVTVSS